MQLVRKVRFFLAVVIAFALSASVTAHDDGAIVITHVWARPTVSLVMAEASPVGEHRMGGTTPSAAYMDIENRGDHPIALVGVTTPVAMMVQIHQTTIVNDVASMAEVEGGIEIAPGEAVSLRPGSFHIMLMDLTQDLAPGGAIALNLTFEMRETDAEPTTITVAATLTDLPPTDASFVILESILFEHDDTAIPTALTDVTLPEGTLAYARLENRGETDVPLASALFMEQPATVSVLIDGELFEIDEYDVGVGETVEIVVALGDVALDDVTTGALPITLAMSDQTTQVLAAARLGTHHD
jgi:hypothetical protein